MSNEAEIRMSTCILCFTCYSIMGNTCVIVCISVSKTGLCRYGLFVCIQFDQLTFLVTNLFSVFD